MFTVFPRRAFLFSATFIYIVFLSGSIAAQGHGKKPWVFAVQLGGVIIDDVSAERERIDSTAFLAGVNAEYTKGHWINTFGLEVIAYDDNDPFSEFVVEQGLFNGDRINEVESDATAVALNFATGYRWLFGANQSISASLQGGYSELLSSERDIANCNDCFTEDIDIEGGFFARGAVAKSFNKWSLGFYARQYFGSDDLENDFGLTIGTAF